MYWRDCMIYIRDVSRDRPFTFEKKFRNEMKYYGPHLQLPKLNVTERFLYVHDQNRSHDHSRTFTRTFTRSFTNVHRMFSAFSSGASLVQN